MIKLPVSYNSSHKSMILCLFSIDYISLSRFLEFTAFKENSLELYHLTALDDYAIQL